MHGFFLLAWLAAANDLRTRVLAMTLSIWTVLVVWGLTYAAFYVASGCAIVWFGCAFTVPALAKVVVAEIAGASVFIYFSHYQIMIIVGKLFGVQKPWLELILAIGVGIALAHAYASSERRVRQLNQLDR